MKKEKKYNLHQIILQWIKNGKKVFSRQELDNLAGCEATRRLRELRSKGLKYDWEYIKIHRYIKGRKEKIKTRSTRYFIKTPLKNIDWENQKIKEIKKNAYKKI